MNSAAYISKQGDQFICSIVVEFESINEVYAYDYPCGTLMEALQHALFYDGIHVTLDAYCDNIAYLGYRSFLENNNE